MRSTIILLIFNTLFILSTSAQSSNHCNEWMKEIADTIPLCQLSIPGTHDSGALDGGEAFQTQDLTLEEQLNLGVRVFDIRLKACENNQLGVYHSIVFQDLYWETDVLPLFTTFLEQHPSETLIVMIKKEGGNGDDFSRLLSQNLNDTLHTRFFIPHFKEDILLGECRGKILFIHRDQLLEKFPGAQCHGWKDNATCLVTLKDPHGNETILSVEDEYQFAELSHAKDKVATIMRHLESVKGIHTNTKQWHITYASATALPEAGPQSFATIVNKQLAQEIHAHTHRPYGIVMVDFAGTTDGQTIIKNLINSNFQK